MRITRVEATNYKSFDKLDIELRPLNLLIGANASGKSNLVSLIRLLKNVSSHGLDNALSMAGGVEYVRNTSIATATDMSVALSYTHPIQHVPNISRSLTIGIKSLDARYHFAIAFPSARRGYKVASDELTITYRIMRLERTEERKTREVEHLGDVRVLVAVRNGKIHFEKEAPPS